ncbi:hypothetical protein HYALB_00008908 [Hymenoscyphus albidus]|uniref:PinX1-related protein 1 n=1 Tax=Hymenoscyphus albidus TaxID=595503 RepID=A0A9N9LT73_9HELO|nr:hypothetical protein HYALB_00008908 [Hymenoscyphus albidus]
MGLAGPKKRIKLSHDPNNTTWTNDTQSFGHKIMTSQGWTPGQYLGAQDAAHAEFHTAANASHIRVTLKDDNLGLGAKIGSGVGHGECTGLDVFKNILGRLNGKDESEIEKEQKSRDDLKRAVYTERKWGSIRFVKGGFLVGDKIQLLIDEEAERVKKLDDGSASSDSDSTSEGEEQEPMKVEEAKKSKKRKAEALVENAPEVVAVKVKKSKKKSKPESRPEQEVVAALSDIKISKRSKKERKLKEAVEESNDSSDESESKRRKREKKERKQEREAKRERKEKKRAKLQAEDGSTKSKSKKSKRAKSKGDDSSDSSETSTKESTPSVPVSAPSSGRSMPMMQGRHAVRARNIAQKRLASMDVASLNQVFMIKS